MEYGIVVDSGCDLTSLPQDVAQKIDFTRVPLTLDIGEQQFIDDFNLNIPDFMKAMYDYPGKTGSAAPSPQAFFDACSQSKHAFIITITGSLSGSYNSAKTAEKLFQETYPDRHIHVIDSRSAGPEISLIVWQLSRLIDQGLTFEKIVEAIEAYRQKTHLVFTLKSLNNLVKNGRISPLKGHLATMLGIKILGTASEEGTLELLHKGRGKLTIYQKALEAMLARGYQGGQVIITYCLQDDMAKYLADCLKEKFPQCAITLMPTSGLCSYYAEEGGLLIGFEETI